MKKKKALQYECYNSFLNIRITSNSVGVNIPIHTTVQPLLFDEGYEEDEVCLSALERVLYENLGSKMDKECILNALKTKNWDRVYKALNRLRRKGMIEYRYDDGIYTIRKTARLTSFVRKLEGV